jgi:hypothetical protein
MAKAFSSSKSGWYYEVKLHKFVNEWSAESGLYSVSGVADFVRLLQRNVKISAETLKID